MISRLLLPICLVVAFTTAAAENSANVDAFQKAYDRYQDLAAEGNYTDALVYAEEALRLGEAAFGEDSKNAARLTLNYGRLLLDAEQPGESSRVLKRALKQYENVYGGDAFELIDPLMQLNHALIRPGGRQILKYYRRALAIAEEQDDAELVGDLNFDAGSRVMGRGKSMEGLRFLDESVDVYTRELGPSHHKTGVAHLFLARFHFSNVDYVPAVSHSALARAGLQDSPELHATAGDLLDRACSRLLRDPKADVPSACR